jgi:DNA modification methylase
MRGDEDCDKRHSPEQIVRLADSLRTHGQQKPVVIQADGTILAGHGLVEGARHLGWETMQVHVYDGTHPDAFVIADNYLATLAEPDDAVLADLLSKLEQQGDLLASGFYVQEFTELRGRLEAANPAPVAEEDEIPEPQEGPTRVQPGEVWALGRHRVMCGDSTDGAAVGELFGEARARMVWTDPPYGVSYGRKEAELREAGYGMGNHASIVNDDLSMGDTEVLVRGALGIGCAFSVPGASLYVACPPDTLLPHFIAAVAASGFEYRHSLVWVKQQFVFGRCDYHYRHETILYGWKTDGPHYFVDDHTKHSVFEYDKPHRSELHPTMKPVALVADMVRNSSLSGEIVYDPFLGSGTTLIAAEQLGRVCYGMEIAPRYCDVILARWEALTGQQAARCE